MDDLKSRLVAVPDSFHYWKVVDTRGVATMTGLSEGAAHFLVEVRTACAEWDYVRDSRPMTTLPRSHAEILTRLRALLAHAEGDNNVQVEASRLLDALPFDLAQEFLQRSVTGGDWAEGPRTPDSGSVVECVVRELPNAWFRANEGRSIAMGKFLAHFRGLAWLLAADELYAALSGSVDYGGKRQLVAVSEHFGFPWRDCDNDRWFETQELGAPVPERRPAPVTAADALATMRA